MTAGMAPGPPDGRAGGSRARLVVVREPTARLIAGLREREDELVQGIFARVSGEGFEETGSQDVRYVEGLREAVGEAVRYALAGIERGGVRLGPAPAEVLEQARRAARAGVSLDTVLRRYVAGHTLLAEKVVEEIELRRGRGERERLRELSRAQAMVLERLLVVITAEYKRELEGAGSKERLRSERVRALLDGDEKVVSPEWAAWPYTLDGWHVGAIAAGTGAAEAVGALADALEREFLCVPCGEQDGVWAWFGGRSKPRQRELEQALKGLTAQPDVVFACGEPGHGLGGWRRTHRQAQAALKVALRRPRQLTRYADVALLSAALADEQLARSLLDAYITPLQDTTEGSLREALRAYLRAGRGVSSAAAALGVARSTVDSRLRTAEERLGISLQHGSPELEIALQLDEIGSENAWYSKVTM